MKFGYYPGCSQKGSAREYELSLKRVTGKLGVDLNEIHDWTCCGATSAHAINHRLANALAMRNVALAEEEGLPNLIAPCAACYNRLITTKNEFRLHPEVRADVEELLCRQIKNEISVLNVIELFLNIGLDKIVQNIKRDLSGLNAACYYGCLLVRPSEIVSFDDSELPASMEKIVQAAGAMTVDWNYKTECCGAAHSIARRDIVVDLSKKIIDDAISHGANLIIVACPMCHTNLDMRQRVMRRVYAGHKDLPVLYLTELVGLAMGMSESELGIDLHYVKFRYNEEIMKKSVAL